MWKEKYEALEAEHKALIEAHDALAARVMALEGYLGHDRMDIITTLANQKRSSAGVTELEGRAPAGGESEAADELRGLGTAASSSPGAARLSPAAPRLDPVLDIPDFDREDADELYRYIIARAQRDPRILQVLARRPELLVTIERETIEADGKTLRGALALLISKKFFDAPQNGNAAFNELKRLGRAVAKPNVYRELDKLAELGFVTKEEGGYQAVPGMTVQILEAGHRKLEAQA